MRHSRRSSRYRFFSLPMAKGFGLFLGLLLHTSAWSTEVVETLALDRLGVNLAMASESNGDIHLAFRAAGGNDFSIYSNPLNYCEVRYLHYTAADNTWHFPSRLISGGCGSVVNSEFIDENQPRIAVDPTTPGRAYVTFGGSIRVRTYQKLAQIDTASNPAGVVTRVLNLGNPVVPGQGEMRSVDVAVSEDGWVYACNAYINLRNGTKNGIYCFRGQSGSSSFTRERATGRGAAGLGLSIVPGGDGVVRVAGTFTNGGFSRRQNSSGGVWRPGDIFFSLPGREGKVRLDPYADDTGSLFEDVFYMKATGDFDRRLSIAHVNPYDGTSSGGTAHRLHDNFYFNNVTDRFSSEDLDFERSPLGRRAIAYGIDGTPSDNNNDLGLILTTPDTADWPSTFIDGQDLDGDQSCDLNCDGLNDLVSGSRSLDQIRLDGVFPYIGRGADGRDVIVFNDGESVEIAFSGEELWAGYFSTAHQETRLSRITFDPEATPTPTASRTPTRTPTPSPTPIILGGALSAGESSQLDFTVGKSHKVQFRYYLNEPVQEGCVIEMEVQSPITIVGGPFSLLANEQSLRYDGEEGQWSSMMTASGACENQPFVVSAQEIYLLSSPSRSALFFLFLGLLIWPQNWMRSRLRRESLDSL